MMEKVVTVLQEKDMIVSRFLFENYKQLGLQEDEFILLIYLLNEEDKIYDPTRISNKLNIPLPQVLNLTNSLKSKDLIKFSNQKLNNKITECLSFEELYKKLGLLLVNQQDTKSTNIFDIFEQEFGRTLSSIEYEIINAWLASANYNEPLILAALKEAVYNGVSNLRYIDKILYEWHKKGIKTVEDIDKKKQNHEPDKNLELYDYDWLNEEK